MKKVAILTINDNLNYGNRLQNYALETFLKSNGYSVFTIWKLNRSLIQKIMIFIRDFFKNKYIKKRISKFRKFNKSYLNIKNYYFRNYKKINGEFDFFIVGSDQVWNYNYSSFSPSYFLDFSNNKKKNISYAASFGISDIPDSYKSVYVNGLNRFNAISVREDSGVELLKNIGFKSIKVLDPTLLLSVNEWKKVISKPKHCNLNSKYVIKFFLGEIPNNYICDIDKFINDNNFDVIDFNDINSKYYYSSPNEFLYYIKNAEIIFTNSFHASVFSIIFNKNFYVYDKNNKKDIGMNSRIDSLLFLFEIFDNRNCCYSDILYNKNPKYDLKKMKYLKQISKDFLLNNLK